MPTFYGEAEVDVDIDEFLEKCSSKELKDLYESLKEDYGDEVEPENIRSDGQRMFVKHLVHLRDNWYSVTKEDVEIIAIIAKKYGSV